MKTFAKKTFLTAAICTTLITGCANDLSNTQKGAGIGAVIGAVAGKGTGDNDKSRYVWGAALGALAGAAIGTYMDKQEEELRDKLADSGVEVYREGDDLRLLIPGSLTFLTNSAKVSPDFYPVLSDVAKILNEFEKTRLSIDGHTDSTGDSQYNKSLSVERANSVAQYLAQQNVDNRRLRTMGYGETAPVASNDTSETRQKNRRVELTIMPITKE